MRRHVHGARAAVGTVARTLVGLSVLASCASAVQAQCDYRSSLEPLESIEGLTPEQIQELRVLREAFATAFERGDERNEALSREENQRIRAVVDGNTEQIFFLRIFDGFMPVPNRYVVTSPGTLRAMSRRPEDVDGLPGNISFGPRSELPQFSEEDPEPCATTEFTRYGLNVEIRDYRGVRWVALYDDSEYLRIADLNLSLWEAMLDVWYELGGRGNE